MEPDDFIALFREVPFKPFTIHMNDGASFAVNHPDQAMVLGDVVFVAHERKAVRCAMLNISRVETEELAPPRTN